MTLLDIYDSNPLLFCPVLVLMFLGALRFIQFCVNAREEQKLERAWRESRPICGVRLISTFRERR